MAVDSILCPPNQLENQPFEEIHVCHGGLAAKTVPATVFLAAVLLVLRLSHEVVLGLAYVLLPHLRLKARSVLGLLRLSKVRALGKELA